MLTSGHIMSWNRFQCDPEWDTAVKKEDINNNNEKP